MTRKNAAPTLVEPNVDKQSREYESNQTIGAGFVLGSAPSIEGETQALLQQRLQATGLVFTFILIGAFLRSFFHPETAILARNTSVLAFEIAVLMLSLSAVILPRFYSEYPLSILRIWEVCLFGSITILTGWVDYLVLAGLQAPGNIKLIEAHAQSALSIYLIIAFIYGMFIPNRWKRATCILLPILLTPILVRILIRVSFPGMHELVDFESVTFFVFVLLSGGGSALYGTFIINNLREESFSARQLGQYRLIEKIGSGGMGEVWKAEHELLARPSAVKLIRSNVLGSNDRKTADLIMKRFEREARETAKLTSPHSIVIYDFGITDEGVFYYVMEHLDGMDLELLVDQYGPIPPERVISLLVQACRSLSDAHYRGLIHRDVKPGNIFVCRMGQSVDFVKVLDFGLVKFTGEEDTTDQKLTKVGTTTGTPAYMAPEQALGEEIDGRADLYALGCVGYFLLTGLMVFDNENPTAMVIDHVKTPPESPSVRSGIPIPEDLESVIMNCLQKSPENRPQTANQLEIDLLACQGAGNWDENIAKEWWAENIHH